MGHIPSQDEPKRKTGTGTCCLSPLFAAASRVQPLQEGGQNMANVPGLSSMNTKSCSVYKIENRYIFTSEYQAPNGYRIKPPYISIEEKTTNHALGDAILLSLNYYNTFERDSDETRFYKKLGFSSYKSFASNAKYVSIRRLIEYYEYIPTENDGKGCFTHNEPIKVDKDSHQNELGDYLLKVLLMCR